MSTEDIPNAVSILADVSHFPSLADRTQQGMLNFLYLGRAMIHPQGFITDPAFQLRAAQPLIDTRTASTTTAAARAGSWAAR